MPLVSGLRPSLELVVCGKKQNVEESRESRLREWMEAAGYMQRFPTVLAFHARGEEGWAAVFQRIRITIL